MVFLSILLGAYAFLGLLYWLWAAYALYRMGHSVAYLGEVSPPEPPRWPRLSVVVPACNEADKLEPALATLLEQDYADLEIVLVDDRSTDDTGRIIDRLAAGDSRVRAEHVAELPDGWLGKVHALHVGAGRCSGEFLLLADADVHYRPGALRKAISYCLARRLDHLAALPDAWSVSFLLDSAVGAFIRQLICMTRPWKASDPASGAFMGVGAFNLVRRSAFESSGGFEWFRMEVADDMALGCMMKRAGARCETVNAFSLIGLCWYRSLAEAAEGAEKGYSTALNFSITQAAVMALVLTALELSPLFALLPLASGRLRGVGLAGLAVFAAFLAASVQLARWSRRPIRLTLLGPLSTPWAAVAAVRAALLGRRRGGVVWRGTLYPTEALRKGKRLWRGRPHGQDQEPAPTRTRSGDDSPSGPSP